VHVILLICEMTKLGDSTSFLDEYRLLGYDAVDYVRIYVRFYLALRYFIKMTEDFTVIDIRVPDLQASIQIKTPSFKHRIVECCRMLLYHSHFILSQQDGFSHNRLLEIYLI
jgi:hypothetical protein